jgi:hypothetical protein
MKSLEERRCKDVGHVDSREDDYTWRSSNGALWRRLQIVIVRNTPNTMYSRDVVIG